MEILKVKATSVPNSVAGALAGVIRERGTARNSSHWCRCIEPSGKGSSNCRGFCSA